MFILYLWPWFDRNGDVRIIDDPEKTEKANNNPSNDIYNREVSAWKLFLGVFLKEWHPSICQKYNCLKILIEETGPMLKWLILYWFYTLHNISFIDIKIYGHVYLL